MRYFFTVIWLLVVCFLGSCKKEEPYTEPVVNIISPKPNESIGAPGKMQIQFRVISQNKLNFIKVSVDDQYLQALFPPAFFYPQGNTAEIDYIMRLGNLEPGHTLPFYLHITVDDGKETNHYYQEVILSNSQVQWVEGFYLITRPAIQTTRLEFYDYAFNGVLIEEFEGDFIDAEVLSREDMIFIAATNPAQIRSYWPIEESEYDLAWEQQPELPFPAYTDLQLFNNMIYAGTGNGTIDGFNYLNGVKKFSTDIAMDSVVGKVGINRDFVIGDFHPRSYGSNAIQCFFEPTGYFIQRYPIFYTVQHFYPLNDGYRFQLFGNTPLSSLYLQFNAQTGEVSRKIEFSEGRIERSSRVGEYAFVVCNEHDLYYFEVNDGRLNLLGSFPEKIVDMSVDKVTNDIYIAHNQKLMVYSYPGLQLLESISTEAPIKAIRLQYSY